MLLRYLKTVTLKKSSQVRQANGYKIDTYETIKEYQAQIQELDDEVSASIYGASIVNMYRLRTPHKLLETYLDSKKNNSEDNISKYYIFIGQSQYKIKSVSEKGVEIELV